MVPNDVELFEENSDIGGKVSIGEQGPVDEDVNDTGWTEENDPVDTWGHGIFEYDTCVWGTTPFILSPEELLPELCWRIKSWLDFSKKCKLRIACQKVTC